MDELDGKKQKKPALRAGNNWQCNVSLEKKKKDKINFTEYKQLIFQDIGVKEMVRPLYGTI